MSRVPRSLLGLAVVAGAALVVLVLRLVVPTAPHHAQQPPTPAATAPPIVQPSATPQASLTALDVARRFATDYLGYDWRNPSDPATALRSLTTDRLYGSFMAGVNPDGSTVPWASVRPELHEVDAASILGTSSQANGGGASVQLQVREDLRTDAGQGSVTKELDLALEGGRDSWRVSWVSERQP